jgi:hypothetical protein
VFGDEGFQVLEKAVSAQEIHGHIDGDGEKGDGPDAALEAGPAFFQGLFERDAPIPQVADHAAVGQGRQEQASDEEDADGAQDGGEKVNPT